jgi:hypothetical protein
MQLFKRAEDNRQFSFIVDDVTNETTTTIEMFVVHLQVANNILQGLRVFRMKKTLLGPLPPPHTPCRKHHATSINLYRRHFNQPLTLKRQPPLPQRGAIFLTAHHVSDPHRGRLSDIPKLHGAVSLSPFEHKADSARDFRTLKDESLRKLGKREAENEKRRDRLYFGLR